jgi:hypothetical protein
VIVTEKGFFKPIYDLFKSIKCLRSDSEELVELMKSVFTIWISLLQDRSGDSCELPLFSGLRSYPYQFDASVDFSLLRQIDEQCDLQELWESLVLNEPVLVFASTPSVASRTVRSLAALLYPLSPSHVLPYLPLTHPRFPELAENPVGIIGTSNPMVIERMKKPVRLLKLGNLTSRGSGDSIPRCAKVIKNSRKLAVSIWESLDCMSRLEQDSLLENQMNVRLLGNIMTGKGLLTSVKTHDFVLKLIRVPLFVNSYRKVLGEAKRKCKNCSL